MFASSSPSTYFRSSIFGHTSIRKVASRSRSMFTTNACKLNYSKIPMLSAFFEIYKMYTRLHRFRSVGFFLSFSQIGFQLLDLWNPVWKPQKAPLQSVTRARNNALAKRQANRIWAANKRFKISKFKFEFPRARTYEMKGLVLGCIEAKFCK